MKYSIDKVQGEYAVCEAEDGKIIDIEIKSLPKKIEEGDIIEYDNKTGSYKINAEETKRKREDVYKLQQKLFLKEEDR